MNVDKFFHPTKVHPHASVVCMDVVF